MSVLCGACNTENRDAAKFCKGCGRKIAQAWPQPEAPTVALAAGPDASALLTGASLGADHAVRAAAPAPAPVVSAVAPAPALEDSVADVGTPRSRISNGPWIGGVLVAVVLLVAAAGWYGHKNRSVPIASEGSAPVATAPGAAAPMPAPDVLPAAPPAPPASPAAAPTVLSEKIELAPAAPEAPKPTPKPRTASAKKAPPPVVVVQEMPAPAPVVAPPAPVVVQTPQSQCGGRNIVATAQCMADQCAKSEFSGHAQCEAVRRQQRLEEEKRNPSLLN